MFIQLHWTREVEGCSKVYSTALDKRSGRLQQGLYGCILKMWSCSKVYSTALDNRSGRLQQGLFGCVLKCEVAAGLFNCTGQEKWKVAARFIGVAFNKRSSKIKMAVRLKRLRFTNRLVLCHHHPHLWIWPTRWTTPRWWGPSPSTQVHLRLVGTPTHRVGKSPKERQRQLFMQGMILDGNPASSWTLCWSKPVMHGMRHYTSASSPDATCSPLTTRPLK